MVTTKRVALLLQCFISWSLWSINLYWDGFATLSKVCYITRKDFCHRQSGYILFYIPKASYYETCLQRAKIKKIL